MRAHGAVARFAIAVLLAASAGAATDAGAAVAPAGNPAGGFAPLDRPGPALSVPAAKLHQAVACTSDVRAATREPILLVPGTNLDPQPNFGWNYERAFRARHWPYCTVTLPDHAMGDVQVGGEYVVYAIRHTAALSGRKVEVLGYSQGGMLPRWALRFWPDTRQLVDDVVGLDPSNHGTASAAALCHVQCPPAYWQQSSTAHFYDALNSRVETFPGIDYTVIYSHTDEVVVPNTSDQGSSALHGGGGTIANIAVQDICPADVSEHLAMGSYDAVGYALAVDAFTHPGAAQTTRIDAAVCTEPFQPGVNPSTFPTDYASFVATIGNSAAVSPEVSSEPPLACYVYATPPASCR